MVHGINKFSGVKFSRNVPEFDGFMLGVRRMYRYMSYKQPQSQAQVQACSLSTKSDSSDSIKRVYLSIDIEYRCNNSEYVMSQAFKFRQ